MKKISSAYYDKEKGDKINYIKKWCQLIMKTSSLFTDKQRQAYFLYYGIEKPPEKNIKTVGQKMDISQSAAQRLISTCNMRLNFVNPNFEEFQKILNQYRKTEIK